VSLRKAHYDNSSKSECSTSESVKVLISAHVRSEVNRIMDILLSGRAQVLNPHQRAQFHGNLLLSNMLTREGIIRRVQELMGNVTSGDYVAITKATAKAVLVEVYSRSTGAELSAALDKIQ
jgi:hypothetical protein